MNLEGKMRLLIIRRSGVFIVYFAHNSCIFQVFLMLTLNMKMFAGFNRLL